MKRVLLLSFAVIALSVGYSQSNSTPCPDVNVEFTSVVELAAGGIRFTNYTQVDPNQQYTYSWDFGNGQVSNEKDPFALFEEGTYQVTLTVLGPNSCQSSASKEVVFDYEGK